MVAELTDGVNFTFNDPRRTFNNTGTGKFVLEGATKKIWVWQNVNTNWTDATGSSIVLQNVPSSCANMQVYGWDGLRSTQAVNGQSAVTISGLTVGETYMFVGLKNTTLPLTLLQWAAEVKPDGNYLFWRTQAEQNVDRFEVEYGRDGIQFVKIRTLICKGNGTSQNEYAFTDNRTSGNSFYRLKMIDKNGHSSYSNILHLRRKSLQSFTVYPNPSSGLIKIDLPNGMNKQVQIFDMFEKLVFNKQLPTSNQIDLRALPKGVYLLHMETQTEKIVLF
jgi:Secretion system C-terminal sorting domain